MIENDLVRIPIGRQHLITRFANTGAADGYVVPSARIRETCEQTMGYVPEIETVHQMSDCKRYLLKTDRFALLRSEEDAVIFQLIMAG